MRLLLVVALLGSTAPVVLAQQVAATGRHAEPLFGVGFDDDLQGPSRIPGELTDASALTWRHPIHVRLSASRALLEPVPGQYDFSGLEARLAEYQRLPAVDVYLDLRGMPQQPEALAGWTYFLRALASREGHAVSGYVIGVDERPNGGSDPRAFAFAVKATAVELRANDPGASVALGGLTGRDTGWLDALYDADVAPYLDAIGAASIHAASELAPVIARRDPGCALVVLGVPLGDAPATAGEFLVAAHLSVLGTPVSGVTYAGSTSVVAASLPVVAFLRDLIDQTLIALDERVAGVVLVGVPSGANGYHRLLFGVATSATYFICSGADARASLALIEASGSRPMIREPVPLLRRGPQSFEHDSASRRSTVGLPASTGPLIVDWSSSGGAIHADRSDVSMRVLPSLAEIIARHQLAQAQQDAVVKTYVVDAFITQHFRPNVADPGYDVATENRFFAEGKQVEFEELSFRLNGTRWGADRPPFPLLQAEKVLSLPLDLRLTNDYRYVFEGVADVDGRACYVVRFDPVRFDQSLFRGTVWLDQDTYLKVKVHTVQTELGAPVLSSEETQRFARAGSIDGRDVFLLVDLVGQQSILIAGRSLMVERHLAFRDFQLNPPDFEAQRQAARDSARIMYRDTDRGLRYLVKRDGQRVVEDETTTRAKALLVGVNVDPSYAFPLPLGGLSYLDFDFLGPESQLAVIWGGILALVNAQRPHLLGKSVDGSVDVFAIAVKSTDRTYDESGEREGERLLTLPFSAVANVGWRATGRVRLLASYQYRFDWFGHDNTTASDFVVPVSTATHGLGLGVEWRRSGYALTASASGHARVNWEPWGDDTTFDPAQQRYLRYSASLSKDFFSGFHKVHLNAGYYGGQHLDRFSQYQFGMFEEHRIHGVPSSGVRFSELGMLRAAYAFNLFDQYRAECAFDYASGRDPFVAGDWSRIIGIGVSFQFRGPFKTLVRGDVGKSFLPPRYQNPGSFVLQLQILKPL